MLRFILRMLPCVGYIYAGIMIITLCGCGHVDGSDVSVPAYVSSPHTKVEVETYTRADGKAPGMDVVITVSDVDACVDSITLHYAHDVRDGAYADLCCNWYRVEDMYGVTWAGAPKGGTFTITPPVKGMGLSKGTWVVHVFFLQEVPPTVESVSFTERKRN